MSHNFTDVKLFTPQYTSLIDRRYVGAMHRNWGPEDSNPVARIQKQNAGVQFRLAGV